MKIPFCNLTIAGMIRKPATINIITIEIARVGVLKEN
jgi:hypothetical protein